MRNNELTNFYQGELSAGDTSQECGVGKEYPCPSFTEVKQINRNSEELTSIPETAEDKQRPKRRCRSICVV